MFESKPEKAH